MIIPAGAPRIPPVPEDGAPRPFWSVMIPTCNPKPEYLEATLRSVLQQDPGPSEMQIEVVDDGSPQGPPGDLVRRLGGNRIQLHAEPVNLGVGRVWNRCLERARGQWVHILHQDDLVRPNFYAALRRGTGPHRVGAVMTRCADIDERGNLLEEASPLLRESAGILEDWQEKIAVANTVRCPAIVVRRSSYEKLGGFLPELFYTLDWEFWQRLAANDAFWFEPAILAEYRRHSQSTTARLTKEAANSLDELAAIRIAMAYSPPDRAVKLARTARKNCAGTAYLSARRSVLSGHPEAARKQIGAAWTVDPSPRTLAKMALLILLYLRTSLFRPRPVPKTHE
jgi:glycosyltransferase involved in cell wall biosynthesis